jgi:hypothetical protein
MMHMRLLRAFLWLSVLAWGIGAGAKFYDLIVVAGAWSASPPESLSLMPYGAHYPVMPGQFFAPTSGATLIGAIGALICGWRTPASYRVWLLSSAILILALWVFTITAFWPSNHALFAAAPPSTADGHAELIRRAHQWVGLDLCRVAMMLGGFISAVRAISTPTCDRPRKDLTYVTRAFPFPL